MGILLDRELEPCTKEILKALEKHNIPIERIDNVFEIAKREALKTIVHTSKSDNLNTEEIVNRLLHRLEKALYATD